ncbi:MAG: PorV/PorQ family protein [Elusimicrobiaceae bacterium]|nr:PorV/PorQ family protein [Elusimicrobiaceae bacterium]
MKTNNQFSLIIAGVLLICCAGRAEAAFSGDDAGTSAAQFLKLGPGARAAGMGGAFTAVAGDSGAIYWNPAGLAGLTSQHAAFTHAQMFEDIRYEWASYALPVWGGALAAGVQYLSYGDVDAFDANGNTEGVIHPGDLAVSLGFGHKLLGLDAGASLKYISSQIRSKATAFAADAGVRYSISGLTLGLNLQNMGSGMKYVNESDPLPFTIRGGAACMIADTVLVSADAVAPRDGGVYGAFGAECAREIGAALKAALRAGYSTESHELDGTKGFALGLGLDYRSYSLDYAYSPMGDLGGVNRFSVGMSF